LLAVVLTYYVEQVAEKLKKTIFYIFFTEVTLYATELQFVQLLFTMLEQSFTIALWEVQTVSLLLFQLKLSQQKNVCFLGETIS